jgi:hypothetical protein
MKIPQDKPLFIHLTSARMRVAVKPECIAYVLESNKPGTVEGSVVWMSNGLGFIGVEESFEQVMDLIYTGECRE